VSEPTTHPPRPPETAGPVDRGGRRALWLAVAGVLAALPLPPLAIVLGIAAVVVAVRTNRRAAITGARAPGVLAGAIVGSLVTVVAVGFTLVYVLFWSELRDYQQCVAGAGTNVARQSCQSTFEDKVVERIGVERR
jgi:hypothetical protein